MLGSSRPGAGHTATASSLLHEGCQEVGVGGKRGGAWPDWTPLNLPGTRREDRGRGCNGPGECSRHGSLSGRMNRTAAKLRWAVVPGLPSGRPPPPLSLRGSSRANGPRPHGCDPPRSEPLPRTLGLGCSADRTVSRGLKGMRFAAAAKGPCLESDEDPNRLPHAPDARVKGWGYGDASRQWCRIAGGLDRTFSSPFLA